MEKNIKIKPYTIFTVTQNVLDNLPVDSRPYPAKQFIKGLKKSKSKAVVIVNPETKELFTTTGIMNNGQMYLSFFPDPVLVFLAQAQTNYNISEEIKKKFAPNAVSSSEEIKLIEPYLYNGYLSHRVSCIIFLFTALEAFINSVIPDNFTYGRKNNDQIKSLTKIEIERHVPMIEKIDCILSHPSVANIDFKKQYPTIYGHIKNLKKERDNLIHLKTSKDDANIEMFLSMFGKTLNDNLEYLIKAIQDFMNIIKPNFVEMITSEKGESKV